MAIFGPASVEFAEAVFFSGYRVNQELWQIKTPLILLGLFPFWLSRRKCRERSMTLPFAAECLGQK